MIRAYANRLWEEAPLLSDLLGCPEEFKLLSSTLPTRCLMDVEEALRTGLHSKLGSLPSERSWAVVLLYCGLLLLLLLLLLIWVSYHRHMIWYYSRKMLSIMMRMIERLWKVSIAWFLLDKVVSGVILANTRHARGVLKLEGVDLLPREWAEDVVLAVVAL